MCFAALSDAPAQSGPYLHLPTGLLKGGGRGPHGEIGSICIRLPRGGEVCLAARSDGDEMLSSSQFSISIMVFLARDPFGCGQFGAQEYNMGPE